MASPSPKSPPQAAKPRNAGGILGGAQVTKATFGGAAVCSMVAFRRGE